MEDAPASAAEIDIESARYTIELRRFFSQWHQRLIHRRLLICTLSRRYFVVLRHFFLAWWTRTRQRGSARQQWLSRWKRQYIHRRVLYFYDLSRCHRAFFAWRARRREAALRRCCMLLLRRACQRRVFACWRQQLSLSLRWFARRPLIENFFRRWKVRHLSRTRCLWDPSIRLKVAEHSSSWNRRRLRHAWWKWSDVLCRTRIRNALLSRLLAAIDDRKKKAIWICLKLEFSCRRWRRLRRLRRSWRIWKQQAMRSRFRRPRLTVHRALLPIQSQQASGTPRPGHQLPLYGREQQSPGTSMMRKPQRDQRRPLPPAIAAAVVAAAAASTAILEGLSNEQRPGRSPWQR